MVMMMKSVATYTKLMNKNCIISLSVKKKKANRKNKDPLWGMGPSLWKYVVSGVQHSDSVFLQIILHYKFLHNNGYSSLCYAVDPSCLSVLVFIFAPFCVSLLHLPFGNCKFVCLFLSYTYIRLHFLDSTYEVIPCSICLL